MKLAFQLAYKNLIGAGLRTWLNVGILSFSFVIIVFFNGLTNGWNQQAVTNSIQWEFGNGELLNAGYDPYNPFSLQDGHGQLPADNTQNLTPILIRQATVYPQGRMMSVLLKGIDAGQKTLKLPTEILEKSNAEIPAIVGTRMATSLNLKKGDQVLVRWRDKNGTFDAANITIAGIFNTPVPTVDNGQIWIPIKKLQEMTGLSQQATLFIAGDNYVSQKIPGWKFENQKSLLKDVNSAVMMERVSDSFIYLMLLAIALLAIFDTQVLSIFRRQREIGTYISLGMTRRQVVKLFTVEGSMYSILATIVGCIYGIPLFIYVARTGIGMPPVAQDMGVGIAERLFPYFSIWLILGTMALVIISATIVSYLPAKKIAKLDPVNALKGKLQ